ncbi:MAG: cation:proton antiporter [Armatimonadetes bacterium]|nr:cation:proton antiporter [Armatimonadota bacterium]
MLSFLLLLGLIIAAAKAAGWASLRLGQPAVLGEILAGVLLGPSLLNVLEWPLFRGAGLGPVVAHLANLGVLFLMFIAGLETDLGQMRRVGRVAAYAGTAGVFVPLGLGLLVALPFGYALQTGVFFGIVLAATSVSITVQTLIELGQLESREGTTLLAAAVIDDVIAIVVLSVFVALAGAGGGGLAGAGIVAVRMAAFLAAAVALGAWGLRRALVRSQRVPVSEGLLAFTVVAVLLYAWGAEALGHVASITGAYIAGVLVTEAGFREEIEHRLRAFTYAILVPVFFVSIGLQTDIRMLAMRDLPFAVLVIVAAVAGKVLGCGGGALAGGFSRAEALRVGVGMVSRGEVGLIVAGIGLGSGLLDARGFAVAVLMVLVTTLLTPVLLRATFPGRPLTEAEAVARVMGEEDG